MRALINFVLLNTLTFTSLIITYTTLFIIVHPHAVNTYNNFRSRSVITHSCPPPELFHPCDCYLHGDASKVIRCGGHQYMDLYGVFQALSVNLPPNQKHYHMFYLNNTSIKQLGPVFHDITFDYLYLDNCTDLETILPQTFESNGQYIKEVRVWGTKLKASMFDALPNLRHLTISAINSCPPEDVIKPCRCIYRREQWNWVHGGFTRIACGGETEDDLIATLHGKGNRTIEHLGYNMAQRLQIYFRRLSEALTITKQFDEFVLQNSPISYLPRNIFADIIFYTIRVDNCPYMVSLHPFTFTPIEPFVQELVIRRTALSNDREKLRDIFTSITSLTNLRVLYLHWSGLQTIPPHAFRPLTGKFQRKLLTISIKYQDPNTNQSLKSIGSYAFYYLPNIKTIDLSLNSINRVATNAFASRWPTNETLEINFSGNNLSSNSFDFGAFIGTQRPIELILGQGVIGNPKLKHLDERVFLPFLKDNPRNKIKFFPQNSNENRLKCDCQSRWLFDGSGKIRPGLEDVMCMSSLNETWNCLPPCLIFGQDLIHCGSNEIFDIKEYFVDLATKLRLPEERHFKRFVLSNPVLEGLPEDTFGNFTFEEVDFDGCAALRYIDPLAFNGTKNVVTHIRVRRTLALSRSSYSSLKFGYFPNLTHVDLSFDGGFRLFGDSFKFENESNEILTIRMNRDNINNVTMDYATFTSAQRPMQLFFDSYKDMFDPFGCQLMFLEEHIYAPFLAAHSQNEIHILWCPIVCDCGIKWLFDSPKDWWRRVDAGHQDIGLQCHDFRSLYLYSGEEFRHCPPSNLLQYFDIEALGDHALRHRFSVDSHDQSDQQWLNTTEGVHINTTMPSTASSLLLLINNINTTELDIISSNTLPSVTMTHKELTSLLSSPSSNSLSTLSSKTEELYTDTITTDSDVQSHTSQQYDEPNVTKNTSSTFLSQSSSSPISSLSITSLSSEISDPSLSTTISTIIQSSEYHTSDAETIVTTSVTNNDIELGNHNEPEDDDVTDDDGSMKSSFTTQNYDTTKNVLTINDINHNHNHNNEINYKANIYNYNIDETTNKVEIDTVTG